MAAAAAVASPLEAAPADWAGPDLGPNLALLSVAQIRLARMLVEERQGHLFSGWPGPGVADGEKLKFFRQVEKLDANYPGGLGSYIRNARRLLADSRAGKNPFDGFTPSVPTGERLVYGDEKFVRYEDAGISELAHAVFVLVAGGLGERLGYGGIKVALPSQITTGTCFLQLYIDSILALQEASWRVNQGEYRKKIPLVIMTSDDTHGRTQELLRTNNYFGMDPSQIHLLKQEKVACLGDNDATIVLDPHDPFLIQTKPHGHGDVHAVLFSSGLLPKWRASGRKWVLFFQDTNGLLFKAIPASLGVSHVQDLDVNSLCILRKAKEPIGGIMRLTSTTGQQMVINVEYNQLGPLLRGTGNPDGDVNDETGFSPYPGNINQLVIKLEPYLQELSRTEGKIVEFVNPKYKDASKSTFKSSTRLECMMQDYPRTLPSSARVGFSVLDVWLAYAPVKNNAEDAIKVPPGNPRHSATSGEFAIYRCNSLILQKAGVEIEDPRSSTFNGQEVEVWPRIIWSPSWALTFRDVKEKVTGSCTISQSSTLVLGGDDISIHNLSLNGALEIHAVPGAKVRVSNVAVNNAGWTFEAVDMKSEEYPEEIRIRGFSLQKLDQRVLRFDKPGDYLIDHRSLGSHLAELVTGTYL